jgi:hypothetical protein
MLWFQKYENHNIVTVKGKGKGKVVPVLSFYWASNYGP